MSGDFVTLQWSERGAIRLLDQTRLPLEEVYAECASVGEIAHAIRTLQVRGAPAIGIAAAMAAPAAPAGRQGVLDEYFGGSGEWREYKFHARKVREYRDAILRNIQIGRVIIAGDIVLVPRKEHIQDYRKWPSVLLAADDASKLQNHFIDMKEQMILDTETLEVMLNRLWQQPISDMKRLFFDDKNAVILGKYQITPT